MWSIPLNLQPELIFNSLIPEMEINVNVLFFEFKLDFKLMNTIGMKFIIIIFLQTN